MNAIYTIQTRPLSPLPIAYGINICMEMNLVSLFSTKSNKHVYVCLCSPSGLIYFFIMDLISSFFFNFLYIISNYILTNYTWIFLLKYYLLFYRLHPKYFFYYILVSCITLFYSSIYYIKNTFFNISL